MRRLAPHLIVFAMLVAFAPHCLFGCSMAMEAAAPTATVGAVMACCAVCPMDHADECLATEEVPSGTDAILQKSHRTFPNLLPVAVAETAPRPAGMPEWVSTIPSVPHSPPVPLHLLNAQFLI